MAPTLLFVAVASLLVTTSFADLPINCTIDDVLGVWTFYEGETSSNSKLDCDKPLNHNRKMKIRLAASGHATQDDWLHGTWTMVYNEGMEVNIGFRSYFAYFRYQQDGNKTTSYCYITANGRSHDVTLRNYACFYGRKQQEAVPKESYYPFHDHHLFHDEKIERQHWESLAEEVNSKQASWTATVYDQFVGMSFEKLQNMAGGKRSWLPSRPHPRTSLQTVRNDSGSFDWRNVYGLNFVSPVRNQGECGSCYAFSSAGMLETRLRVYSKNNLKPILSPQDIVSCTTLAQGCSGGFPYLIAGRYGWETGFVDESCNPYKGKDGQCIKEKCGRWYVAGYSYVGGYYGACNEAEMKKALLNGPVAVSFEVNPDFMSYKSGIYRHTSSLGTWDRMRRFETVNHAVLLVGYGVDDISGDKYWVVKNSWGEDWGENGYFRILRGVDEVGIESIAVEAFPIPNYPL